MNLKMKKVFRLLEIPVLFFVLPLLLCIIFKILPLGSIGPIVFLTFLVEAVVFPILIYRLLRLIVSGQLIPKLLIDAHNNTTLKTILAITLVFISLVLGIPLAGAGLSYFVGLTSTFGILDYDLI